MLSNSSKVRNSFELLLFLYNTELNNFIHFELHIIPRRNLIDRKCFVLCYVIC